MALQSSLTREEAWKLFLKYNKDPFHVQHALTVEAVMKWYAGELGFGGEADFWAVVGLLHDIDFEEFPDQLLYPKVLKCYQNIQIPQCLMLNLTIRKPDNTGKTTYRSTYGVDFERETKTNQDYRQKISCGKKE
jgi:hypothetical protein